jgi:hypothetical protein
MNYEFLTYVADNINTPYKKYFKNSGGRRFGNWVVEEFIDLIFNECLESDNIHYDRMWKGKKVEVKAIRATYAQPKSNYLDSLKIEFEDRALYSINGDQLHGLDKHDKKQNLSNLSFQQIKSSEFDIFIGFVFFLDLVRVYVVPAEDIASDVVKEDGKIRITHQHRNNSEGHMTLGKVREYMKFELNSSLENIKQRDLGEYIL